MRAARRMVGRTARLLGIPEEEVLVASTGVIGQRLPVEKIVEALPTAVGSLARGGGASAADAILTTDLRSKQCARSVETLSGRYTVGGMAKGSGMIHPNMATTLAFVTTDAAIGHESLQACLRRATEVSVFFQTIPFCLFGREEVCQRIEPNVLTLRIQPDDGIALRFATKVPGDDLSVGTVTMDFSYASSFKRPSGEAYERLLLDAMRGDATLFARRDGDEKCWELVQPLLDEPVAPSTYERGGSGPREADDLIRRDKRRWRPLA